MSLVLASTSGYRRELLSRLGLPFETRAPNIDESSYPDEQAADLCSRLALQKARATIKPNTHELIIGADQVAVLDEQILYKPGNAPANKAQLRAASGRKVAFYTGVCLLNTATDSHALKVSPFEVRFRKLSAAEIDRYVEREPAFDCAGGFKCEGLGISLFESMSGPDPTALIGLPLIALCAMLRREGMNPLLSD